MDPDPVIPQPSWRKPAGIGLILLFVAVWAVIIATLSDLLVGLPWPVHLAFYLIAGLVWVLPVRPLLRWMER